MVHQSQFISQFGFPQDGEVKYQTSAIEDLLEGTISGEWGTDCADESGTRVIRTTNFTNEGVLNLDDVVFRTSSCLPLLHTYNHPLVVPRPERM